MGVPLYQMGCNLGFMPPKLPKLDLTTDAEYVQLRCYFSKCQCVVVNVLSITRVYLYNDIFRTGIIGCQVKTLGKLFTQCASVTKQFNLVPVAAQRCPATGKVTVGLALHWPCITDLSGLSTYGLKP